jgi:hypothetical protein
MQVEVKYNDHIKCIIRRDRRRIGFQGHASFADVLVGIPRAAAKLSKSDHPAASQISQIIGKLARFPDPGVVCLLL